MNKNNGVLKDMLSSVHKLLRLMCTIPITSATSERTFSTMKRINTYLRSSMTEKCLNNCLLLNAHKELTENLDLILIAEEFVEKLDERKKDTLAIFYFCLTYYNSEIIVHYIILTLM